MPKVKDQEMSMMDDGLFVAARCVENKTRKDFQRCYLSSWERSGPTAAPPSQSMPVDISFISGRHILLT